MRAVAALLVFLAHAGLRHILPGGFGVTIFFFLSGYLITTLLRREHEQHGAISLRQFYLRRTFRILPPMYAVLLVIVVLDTLGAISANQHPAMSGAQLLQVTNYYLLSLPEAQWPNFTVVFWSLAVEEHFYLLFPVFLVAALRRWNYATIARALLLACVAVLCWRLILVHGMHASENRTYLATDTRLDGLLFGCIMGLWRNPALDAAPEVDGSLTRQLIIGLGAVAIILGTFAYRGPAFRETWRYTLQGLALFPIFWLAVRHPAWPCFRPLNYRWVRGLGVISYSFYLTHIFWLVEVEKVLHATPLVNATVAFGLTVACAALMHQFIEKPFTRMRSSLRLYRKAPEPVRSKAVQYE